MARNRSILNLSRSLAEEHHIEQLAASVRAPLRPPLGSSRPQASDELAPKSPAALHEERLIDRLVRHAHLPIIGMVEDESRSDLLRGPSQAKEPLHLPPQPRGGCQLRGLRATRSSACTLVRSPRAIRNRTASGLDLARHSGRRSAQTSCDDALRISSEKPPRDLFPLGERQPQGRSRLRPGLDATGLREQSLNRFRGAPDRGGRALVRLAGAHSAPQFRLLSKRQTMRRPRAMTHPATPPNDEADYARSPRVLR